MDHERDAECGPMLDFHAVVHMCYHKEQGTHEPHGQLDMNGGTEVWDPTEERAAASPEERE